MAEKNRKYRIKADDVDIFPVLPESGEKNIWKIRWEAFQKKDEKKKVGTISFSGEPELGRTGVIVEPEPEFKDSKEMKTALSAMVSWAFNQKKCYELTAEALHEDDAMVYLLQAGGLVYREGTRTVEYYSATKQRTSWTGLYIVIGIISGLILTVVFDSPYIGMPIGIFAGFAVGAIMDQKETAEVVETTGNKSLSKRYKLRLFKKRSS